MSIKKTDKSLFRMPTAFGPMPGPRQTPDGQRHDWSNSTRTVVTLPMLVEPDLLVKLLPAPFELAGNPLLVVEWQFLRNLPWLAGRGYNIVAVKLPARHKGKEKVTYGYFMAVLWENMADPIISGREELGFAKLYADIPDTDLTLPNISLYAAWDGFSFAHMQLTGLKTENVPAIPDGLPRNEGTMHLKSFPRTGEWGELDVAYPTLTPPAPDPGRVEEAKIGSGKLSFHCASFQELPTLFHIVNGLAGITIREFLPATLIRSKGGYDLYGQRRLD
ncbi:acetoacetate decarboxylase family protein [Marinobacter salarius]|uniref:acetoacetate decarboxylase family protein n=1 Tax=Marinobacter salarius TaxID=1420917 RepID=UPI0032EB91E8